ncbi:MAG TPA: hypothetical protein VGT78_01805 [Rhizomicrobium sp.]|nr:hypothetical protein [Rhizomicrobium sp.]
MRFLALAAAAAVLGGCSTTTENNCPLASALVDTSSLTMFAAGTTRPLYTVQVAKVDSDCSIHKYEHTVSTDVDISFTATRPTSGSAAEYNVIYFVATTQSSRILAKRRFRAHFRFEPEETTTTFTASVDSNEITVEKSKKAYDYALLVGLQLTKDQLEYNRTVGRYPK